jgi:hypothetical protein
LAEENSELINRGRHEKASYVLNEVKSGYERVLEDLAKTEKRSLSSLVENILDDYLTKNQIEWERQERRGKNRKVINMPAQFQIRCNYIPEVQNVLIQDIIKLVFLLSSTMLMV